MRKFLHRSLVGIFPLLIFVASANTVWAITPPSIPAETSADAKVRHARIAERRNGTNIICHRGASEFAHENTLEAYRATFELGGDGNEVDIRATNDGVLVCFHDDMLDRLLEAYGDVSDYTWNELQQFRFRDPGSFGARCRIPTLVEVLQLHRQHAGLMHLDIKRTGLDAAIAELLSRMDMWDQVAFCNTDTGGVILRDPRLKLRRYKGTSLYSDRSEVFPEAIAAALKRPGDDIIVDDPRGVAVALGRKFRTVSSEPVAPLSVPRKAKMGLPAEAELIAVLCDADDWSRVVETTDEKEKSARRIVARARSADQLCDFKTSSNEAFAALEERVRKRSLHKDWLFHGLDGATSLRSLIVLHAPNAVDTARFVLWRDDPALEPLIDPRWKSPRASVDFRAKILVFPALESFPGPASAKLCRDYLALSSEAGARLGPTQFEEAAKALLAISPHEETARELLRHRLQLVRGRVILDCLARVDEPWAGSTLKHNVPHALAYQVTYGR